MNKKRREQISKVVDKLEVLKSELECILMDEEMVRDSLEEHFSGTERYEISEEACDLLQDAIDSLEEIL